ncbi:MAG: hypothetical protein PHF99_10925, partial [Bacteroidales bacterium]|nr:hypothetical protein [Bacteroidales bacterium]
ESLQLSLCICFVAKLLKYKDISASFDAYQLHKANRMNNAGYIPFLSLHINNYNRTFYNNYFILKTLSHYHLPKDYYACKKIMPDNKTELISN